MNRFNNGRARTCGACVNRKYYSKPENVDAAKQRERERMKDPQYREQRKEIDRQYRDKKCRRYEQNPALRARDILNDYRKGDRRRGFVCDVSHTHLLQLLSMGCAYCGEKEPKQLGLDRIYNDQGHTTTNVVPCCARCNFIRRDMPIEAWRFIAPQIKRAKRLGLFGSWEGRFGLCARGGQDAEARREHMRDYMKKYRSCKRRETPPLT
jgi:hypothetical protein